MNHWRRILVIGCCLIFWVFALCPLHAGAPDAMRQWMLASQAYRQQRYREAHEAYTLLQQTDALPVSLREEMLWNDAHCLQQMGQPAAAAGVWEALLRLAPRSAYATAARPCLYRHYLSTGTLTKAESLWRDAMARDGATAINWQFVPAYLQYAVTTAPDHFTAAADRIRLFTVDSVTMSQDLYVPLIRNLQFTEARAYHERLQAVLAARHPAVAIIEQQAYDETLSQAILQTVSARFTAALADGDIDAARTWLTTLNTQAPEHPLAVQARQAYRNAQQPAATEDAP